MADFTEKWQKIDPDAIGKGGQGEVYLVARKDGNKEEKYVVKQLKNRKKPQPIARFKREVDAIKNLSHEHIIKLIDFNVDIDKPYLVTEYCVGGSLDNVKDPFWRKQPVEALKLFQQICEGIKEAHSKGIIHRDIKPENILLRTETDQAVITDFGICFLQDEQERLTMLDENVGTKKYMAPEVEDGKVALDQLTNKCDIYSLGKVLYWLFAGKVFNREKQRDSHWDLKAVCNNVKMEYVNNLLDKMIVESPSGRVDIDTVLIEIASMIRLFERNFNMIQKGVPQNCIYCGIGIYQNLAKSKEEALQQYGMEYGNPNKRDWRVCTCNYCGNVQFFRVDLCENKGWLNENLPTNKDTSVISTPSTLLTNTQSQIAINSQEQFLEKYPNFIIRIYKERKSKPNPKQSTELGTYPPIYFDQHKLEINNIGDELATKIKLEPILLRLPNFGDRELKIEFKEIVLLNPREKTVIDYRLLDKNASSNEWGTLRDSREGVSDYDPISYLYQKFDCDNPYLLKLTFRDNKHRSYSQIINVGREYTDPQAPTLINIS